MRLVENYRRYFWREAAAAIRNNKPLPSKSSIISNVNQWCGEHSASVVKFTERESTRHRVVVASNGALFYNYLPKVSSERKARAGNLLRGEGVTLNESSWLRKHSHHKR